MLQVCPLPRTPQGTDFIADSRPTHALARLITEFLIFEDGLPPPPPPPPTHLVTKPPPPRTPPPPRPNPPNTCQELVLELEAESERKIHQGPERSK